MLLECETCEWWAPVPLPEEECDSCPTGLAADPARATRNRHAAWRAIRGGGRRCPLPAKNSTGCSGGRPLRGRARRAVRRAAEPVRAGRTPPECPWTGADRLRLC